MTAVRSPRFSVPLVVLVTGSIVAALSLGVRSTFGLFQDDVIADLSVNRGQFGLAIALQAIMWGVTQPVAGAIADRYGAARVIVFGAVAYAGGVLLLATADGRLGLLSFGFVSGVAAGSASFAVVLASVGRMASPERRSMALGIITAMGSVGQFVLIPLARVLLDRADWRTVLLVFAAIAGSILLFSRPLRGNAADQDAESGSEPLRPLRQDLARAARSSNYLMLNAAFFVCGFHVTYIATHLPAYVGDLGITASAAAWALALIGLFNVFGSLGAGWLGSRRPPTDVLVGIYGARAVVIALYLVIPASSTSTIVFGAAIGVLWLSTVPGTSAIVASLFGTANAGALFGIVFLSHQAGAFVGAWMGGVLADSTGSYNVAWWTAVALAVFASVMHLFIDGSPEPDEPTPLARRRGLAPGFGVAAIVAMGFVALFSRGVAADGADAAAAAERPAFICVIG